MPAEINIPVRLELLKGSINELQNVLSNLKPNTQSFRTISKYIQDMTKEMTQFQALTSRAFSNQSQFNRGNKSIERMETILDKAKIAMGEIKFPEIKLSGEQQAQWDGLNKTLEDAAAKFEQIKEKVKDNILSDSTAQNLFSNMDPKYMEKNFDQLFDMVDRKTQELSRKMVNAKQKLAEFNGQKTSQGKRIESLTTNGISSEAIGQAAFDRFFTKNDKGEAIFKRAGVGETPMKQQFLEYLKEIYSLSDADISKLQADLGQKGGVAKLNKIFTSMGKDNMFTKALEKSTFAKSDKLERSLTEAEDAYNKYQELLNKFQTASDTGANGAGAGEVGAAFTEFQQKAQAAREAILAFSTDTERAFSNNGIKKGIDQGNTALENYRNTLKQTNSEFLRYEQASRTFSNMKMAIGNFMGFYQVLNLTKRAVKEAASHIKDLDSVMNKISIVTDMSTGDLWNQIDAYSQMAQKYGVSIKGAYEVSQIYYQQGLKQSDVLTLTNETLKLSKISGLDYAESTDYMTTAIRGFKLEATDASRVVDVYSNLASHTAVTQGELAIGMSKTASSLESVGASFEESSAMIATMVAVTRESSTNIGSAMKSIAARYGEMKKDISSMVDEEGEALSYNKVDTALQSVGISLKDTDGQFRNITDVIIELGEKWDTLDSIQQRYIATQFAGNRQQSRFLALVSNVDLLKSNLAYAEDSKDTGDIQALKTLDSIETKQEQLKVAYQQMYTSIGAEDMWKGALGGLTDFMNTLNGLPKLFGKIPIGAISMIGDIVMVLKSAGRSLLSGVSNIVLKSLPADAMAAKAREAMDAYRQAAQSETERKAPELQKTGQELSNQISRGTEKAQNDLNQPAAKPEVAEQAMKPAEQQVIDTATQSQMNAASAEAEATALEHRNQVLAEGTGIAEANASATSATADANREASIAATEQTNVRNETAQLTLPMTADNKPVLEAAQQARDAIAGEPATMKIVGESSINPNGGGAPAPGGQALAGGNVQVLMGELGPEMYVSNGQYFIAGQSGPEMVSLPPDAIVFNHLQTDDLLKKESTFGTGHPITNERNAVAMASGTDPSLLGLVTSDSTVSMNVTVDTTQATDEVDKLKSKVEEGATFPIDDVSIRNFEATFNKIQKLSAGGSAISARDKADLSQSLAQYATEAGRRLSFEKSRLDYQGRTSGISAEDKEVLGRRLGDLFRREKALDKKDEETYKPQKEQIATIGDEIDALTKKRYDPRDVRAAKVAPEAVKPFLDTEKIDAAKAQISQLEAERDQKLARVRKPLDNAKAEVERIKAEKEAYTQGNKHPKTKVLDEFNGKLWVAEKNVKSAEETFRLDPQAQEIGRNYRRLISDQEGIISNELGHATDRYNGTINEKIWEKEAQQDKIKASIKVAQKSDPERQALAKDFDQYNADYKVAQEEFALKKESQRQILTDAQIRLEQLYTAGRETLSDVPTEEEINKAYLQNEAQRQREIGALPQKQQHFDYVSKSDFKEEEEVSPEISVQREADERLGLEQYMLTGTREQAFTVPSTPLENNELELWRSLSDTQKLLDNTPHTDWETLGNLSQQRFNIARELGISDYKGITQEQIDARIAELEKGTASTTAPENTQVQDGTGTKPAEQIVEEASSIESAEVPVVGKAQDGTGTEAAEQIGNEASDKPADVPVAGMVQEGSGEVAADTIISESQSASAQVPVAAQPQEGTGAAAANVVKKEVEESEPAKVPVEPVPDESGQLKWDFDNLGPENTITVPVEPAPLESSKIEEQIEQVEGQIEMQLPVAPMSQTSESDSTETGIDLINQTEVSITQKIKADNEEVQDALESNQNKGKETVVQQPIQSDQQSSTTSPSAGDLGESAKATEETASKFPQIQAAFQNLKEAATTSNSEIQASFTSLVPEGLISIIDGLGSKLIDLGTNVVTKFKQLPQQMGSFGMALSMVSNIIDKTSRGGQQLAGAIMTIGGAIRTIDALTKAAAESNPWLAIAMGIMAVVNGINMIIEDDGERLERLNKEAEEADNNAKKATSEYKKLKNSKTQLDELEAKRYDSVEATEEYQKAVDELTEQFPALILGFDEAGEVILNTAAMEDELAAARDAAAEATLRAAEADRKYAEEKAEQALKELNDIGKTGDSAKAWVASIAPAATESKWSQTAGLGVDYFSGKVRYIDGTQHIAENDEEEALYRNLFTHGIPGLADQFIGGDNNLEFDAESYLEFIQSGKYEDYLNGTENQVVLDFYDVVQSLQAAINDDDNFAAKSVIALKALSHSKTLSLGQLYEEHPEAFQWFDIDSENYDPEAILADVIDDRWLNWMKEPIQGTKLVQDYIDFQNVSGLYRPSGEEVTNATTLIKSERLIQELAMSTEDIETDLDLVQRAQDNLENAVTLEQKQQAYNDLRLIEKYARASTADSSAQIAKWYDNYNKQYLNNYGEKLSAAVTASKERDVSYKKEIQARSNQILQLEDFYGNNSGLTEIINARMFSKYKEAKQANPDIKFTDWMTENENLITQMGQAAEDFWEQLSLEDKELLPKMLKDTNKYSFKDIVQKFNIGENDPIYHVLSEYYDEFVQTIQKRFMKKIETSSIFSDKEMPSQLIKARDKFIEISQKITTTEEESYLNAVYKRFSNLVDSGYLTKASDYSVSAISLLETVQGIEDLDIRHKVFELIDANGVSTIEGINKSIESIKADTIISDSDKNILISKFETIKSNIINNINLSLQAATDSFLESWEQDSKTLAKLNSGIDIKDIKTLTETDAAKLMNGGEGLKISDFIMDGNKLILSAEKSKEYIENYFKAETASLEEYKTKIDDAKKTLGLDKEGKLKTGFEDGDIIDETMQEQIETLIGVGSLKKYATFADGKWVINDKAAGDLNNAIEKGYEQAQDNLDQYTKYLEVSKEQAIKTLQWQQGDYSSLKSIYKNFKGFWKNNDKILTKQVNKRLIQLVAGTERMTEEEQAQPEIKNAVEQIRSAYGTFINDLVTKDIDTLYASDYLQTGLGKNIIETQMAQAQDATARSFALWVAGLADAAGQTIAEQNDVFVKAWNKKNDQTTTKGLEGLEFIGTDIFSADTEQLKTFADTYDIKLSDLVEQGIAVYNDKIDRWLVDVTQLQNVGFDSSKITNFQETVADSVNAFFDQLSQLIQNGLSGSLSNADATLLQQYAAMLGIEEGLDFTRTAEGLQLSEQSAIRLYATLKKIDSLKASLIFDKLRESLEKNNDNFKSVSTLTGHIAKIQKKIYENDGRVSTARLKQYEAELEVAREILEVRSTSEDSSFNFMSNKIPAAQNNPLNYAANWTQALGKIRDAWNLSKVKKSGKAGFMDYTDFYNIVTEMNNIAALGGPIEVGAYTLDGKLESAAALIQAGADALTAIDTGEVMVDLSGIGLALSQGGSSLEAGITDGIQAMAESQVKMLDGLIAMLEIVVAMEQLGDIAGENNVIDFGELFTITSGEEVTEEILDQVDAFDKGFKIAAKKIKDYLDKDENKEVKKIFQKSSVNFGNGIKYSMYEMLDIGDDEAFERLFPSSKLSGNAKKAALKTYQGVMNSLYQAVMSGDYDLDNIAESAQKEFAAAGLLDHPITIELDDTTFVFSNGGTTKIEWDSQIVQDLKKKYNATEEEITQVVERYVSGETLTSQKEFEYILVLHGQAEIKNGELIVKCGGNSYTGDEITGQILGQAALEDAGIKLDEGFETNDNEVVGTITYKGTTQQETRITVKADATGIHYQGMDNQWYATEDQAMEANFKKQDSFSDIDEYKWQIYGKRATIKSTVTVDDVEVDLSIPSDVRTQAIEEISSLTLEDIKSDGKGGYIIDKNAGMVWHLDASEVINEAGEKDLKKTMNSMYKRTGIDQALQENITAGIKDAIPAIVDGLKEVDASNLQAAANALGEMANNLSTLQGISYEKIAQGLAQLGIHLNNQNLNIPEGGTTPQGGISPGGGGSPDTLNTPQFLDTITGALQEVDTSNLTTVADTVNNLNPAKAENIAKALNTLDATQVTRIKNVLNSLSITGKTVRAIANIVVQVTHGSGGGSSAKGNIALASGTPTLMGELGPELVVSNGRYFVVGQAGAEFVNLQKDAIVFNHKQTQNLLNNGSIGSRGKPFTNETNAISYAKGNWNGGPAHKHTGILEGSPDNPELDWKKDWTYTYNIRTTDGGVSGHLWGAPVAEISLPSAAKGSRNGGPAKASAAAALAALKQLRAQWQALAKLSAKDLAGKGGGGGGGGKAANFIKDLERWYNLLQEIAKLEKEITYQETLRNKIASDLAPNGEAYVKSQALTLKYLQREVEAAQQLSLEQEDYFKVRQEQLNKQSAFSELYTFDDEGQIKYKSGKFAQLSEIFGGDDTTGEPNHSVKEQYQYLIDQGYGYAMEYNESGEKIKIDNKNDETNMKAAIEAFWAKIESDKTEMQELHDSVEEQKDAVLQKMQAQNELLKEIEENQISVEGKVLKAIEDAAQREIDEIKDQKDALQDSNDALIDGLTDALEKERNLYDTSQSESELAQKRRQLAILERSGGSASEIKNLRAEIDSSSKDLYFEKQQEQIDAIQDASDIQIKKMEEQIELMEESLEYQKEHGLLWNEVYTVMQGSPEDIATFIKQNDSEYWGKSPTDLTKTIRDDLFEAEKYVAYRDTVTDEIKVIADLLTTQNLDTEWKQFGDMMTNSAEYKDAWGKLSDKQRNNLKAIYSEEFKSSADPNAAARKVWDSQLALDYGITKKKEINDNSSNYSNNNNQNNSGNQNQTATRWGIKKVGDQYQPFQMAGGAYGDYNTAKNAAEIATKQEDKKGNYKYQLDKNKLTENEKNILAGKKSGSAASGGYVGHGIYELGELGTETVLTASQTKILRDNILSNRPNSLINLLKSYNEAYHGLSASTYDSITSNTDNGTVIEHAEVNVHVDKLANGYDAEKAGDDIMRQMLNIARKTKAQNRVGR